MTRLRVPVILLLAAAACGVAALDRTPVTGLMLTRFSDAEGLHPDGAPTLDQRLYFATGDDVHPVPSWVGPRTSSRWEGYFDAPRLGEYAFKLTADDAGAMGIDGVPLISIPGEHPPLSSTANLFLTKGLHEIRLEHTEIRGGSALKVEMRLPSGYSAMGLLPVSLLHPTRPLPVTWGDRTLRLLSSLFVLASIASFFRERLRRAFIRARSSAVARRAALAGLLVFALALGVRLYDIDGAGETADEWAYQGAARIYADNIAAGDFDPEQWKVNREHPALGKLAYAWVYFNFGDSPTTARDASAVMNSLTCLLAFLIARRLFGVEVATLSGLILALIPSFVAHGKVAALDSPATLMHTVVIWLLFRGLHDTSTRKTGFSWLTVAVGLAMATKLTNVLLLPFILIVFPLLQWRSVRKTADVTAHWSIYGLGILAWIPFFATWPWLWGQTVGHLTETFQRWAYVPGELFFGTNGAPRIYFAVSFLAVMPILLAPFFGLGLAQAFVKQPMPVIRSGHDDPALTDRVWWLLVLGWFLLPFGWSFTSFRQDTIRYVLAAFPPFAVLTSAGVVRVAERANAALQRRGVAGGTRWIVPAFGAGLVLYLGFACLQIHPYYLDYYNELMGGPSGAYYGRRLETGWWGEGLDRAIAYLNDHAEQHATYQYRGFIDHTFVGLRPDLTRTEDKPAYVVRTDMKPGDEAPAGYDEAFVVRARGAPLVGVFQRRH